MKATTGNRPRKNKRLNIEYLTLSMESSSRVYTTTAAMHTQSLVRWCAAI
jgi:hypothetical protein